MSRTHFNSPRSPMSAKAPMGSYEASLRGIADPAEKRLLAERDPTPASAAAYRDPLDELAQLVVLAVGQGVKSRLSAHYDSNGFTPAAKLYKVELYGPEVGERVVRSQGGSPAAAALGLNKSWAKARRAHEVTRLIAECERLAGDAFTPEKRLELESQLATCAYTDYPRLAAKWRAAAVKHANAAA